MLVHRYGDILDAGVDAIIHGVNCQGRMGGGLARQIAERHPDVAATYTAACYLGYAGLGRILPVRDGDRWIVNAFTQDDIGPDARPWAIQDAVDTAVEWASQAGLAVALPKIGCGIGGLDWEVVEPIVADIAEHHGVTIEVWDFEPAGR